MKPFFYLPVLSILAFSSFSCYDMMNTSLNASLDAASAAQDSDNTDTTVEETQAIPAAQPDTVYLKDGSIIHGLVIEEVPGESLKIRTRSGNIFTYQMADVAKITHRRTQVNADDDASQDTNSAPAAPNNGGNAPTGDQ